MLVELLTILIKKEILKQLSEYQRKMDSIFLDQWMKVLDSEFQIFLLKN